MKFSLHFLMLIAIIISILCGVIAYFFTGFFLSRKDHYVNSSYALFMKKIGLCMPVALGVFYASLKMIDVCLKSK